MSTFNNIGTNMLHFANEVFSGLKGSQIKTVISDVQKGTKIAEASANAGSLGYRVGNFLGGGTRRSIQNYKAAGKQASVTKAIKDAHMVNGKIDGKAVAGTAIGASIVGRVATGGGLYRDKDGNVNIPGVPFI